VGQATIKTAKLLPATIVGYKKAILNPSIHPREGQ